MAACYGPVFEWNSFRYPQMNAATTTSRYKRLLLLFAAATVVVALWIRIQHDRVRTTRGTFTEVEQQAHAHPNDLQAQLDWGDALYGQHRLAEAEIAFKTAANLAPNDTRPLNALARLSMEQNRRYDGLGYLQASLKLNPNDAALWRFSGMLLLNQNPPMALQAFEHATSLDPNDAVSWLHLGILEMDRDQFSRGLHALQHAAALNPNDLETEIALGNSARVNYRPTIARDAYDKALSLRPDDPSALLGSANMTLQLDPSPTGLTRAGQQLEKVIAIRPNGKAYLARGQWNLLMRRYHPAITDLKMALSLDPKLYFAHSFLSQCYAALGQTQPAKQESRTFLASTSTTNTKPVTLSSETPRR